MSAADADVVAEALVWANLRGGDGHGVARLPRYLEMIERGEMDPQRAIELRDRRRRASSSSMPAVRPARSP